MHDIWFAEFERLLDEGMTENLAAESAMATVTQWLADCADNERKRRKEEGLS